jgi:hypothetical protein
VDGTVGPRETAKYIRTTPAIDAMTARPMKMSTNRIPRFTLSLL